MPENLTLHKHPSAEPTWKAIVFDFDGTLAELHLDFREMRSAVNDLASSFNLQPEVFSHLYILEMIDSAVCLLAEASPSDGKAFLMAAMKLIEDMEIQAARRSSLFPGVKEMLNDLGKQNVSIGIITRNCRHAVSTVFPDYDRYIGAILSREMTRYVKPDPRHLTGILSLLNIAPGQALMVGDHPIDVRIGREVGTATAAVLTGTGGEDELRKANPDFLLQRVLEVKDIVFNHHPIT
ncbi:MAG: HAD family hydrolase [Syntrophaceae bacterium]|nr:HAD family hydrolase [Syntrophaceae bacterium]